MLGKSKKTKSLKNKKSSKAKSVKEGFACLVTDDVAEGSREEVEKSLLHES